MHELRVVFAPDGDGRNRARLTDADGRALGVETPFTPFLDEGDYRDLRWYLEEYLDLPDGGAVVRARGVEDRLARWGRALHDALFGDAANREQLDALLDAPPPRELTIATQDAALLRLPWELMADDAGGLAQRVSVRRQLERPRATAARAVELPLRILYVVSRPTDAGFLDPRLTAKGLLTALDPLGASAQVDFCRPPTLARMEEMLRDAQAAGDPYDLLHFDGHGTFLPQDQVGALCFEHPEGAGEAETDLVDADRLGTLLAEHRVPLVVLEACRSATVGETAVFRAVAPRLIQAGVRSVLSMGHAVHVEAARLLLDRFYRELARGATIGEAVAQGRKALQARRSRWIEAGPQGRAVTLEDWFLPHLYQRGEDGPLIPAGAASSDVVRQYDVFLSHNHAAAARVERLARTLSETHKLRVWFDTWEARIGDLEASCAEGIRNSRFTFLAATPAAVASRWVQWEIEQTRLRDGGLDRLLPAKLEPVDLPADVPTLYWVDMRDPAHDEAGAREIAALLVAADIRTARERRGFRPPPAPGEPGAFPPPPRYDFTGRAQELYALERRFRQRRGLVLHAMGGMGKTSLAAEAARWWTRTGLFRDGACFVSFEQFTSAERVVQVLGAYLVGPSFDQLPPGERRRRAVELFRERAVLLVWDNYESALPQFNDGAAEHGSPYDDEERRRLDELFSELTSGAGKGCVLVTCRPGETGLPGAGTMELQGLARADSLWLLHRILEADGRSLDDRGLTRERLEPLLRDLADHPLSLELVGPHLRTLTPEAIRKDFGALLERFRQAAPEARNTSLLASLEFSRRHLSAAAREVLPWLGLFRGGVFEDVLLGISQIDPPAWASIRDELQGIALVRVENDVQVSGRPFLRFHPTLALAAADTTLAADQAIRTRFVNGYGALMRGLNAALKGAVPRAALEVLAREEANYRTAVAWAVTAGRLPDAAAMGDTFRSYLERTDRLRERDAWVAWLREAVRGEALTAEAAAYEREHAWTRLTQGDPAGAVAQLEALVVRLGATKAFDPAFQLALTQSMLGRVLSESGAVMRALPVLRAAISAWEVLVERKGGRPWQEVVAMPAARASAATALGNLSATRGDLANVLRAAGEHAAALAVAEEALSIDEAFDNRREVAVGHGQCASILANLGRIAEADARHERALAAAREAGDQGLEGALLQHQGSLADDRGQMPRAVALYRQALARFQAAGNQGAVMRTYNLLGVAEQKAGRLAEAREWYARSRELAEQLRDQPGLGDAAQNLGIVWQLEGEAARARGEAAAARRHFEEARGSVEESLRIKQGHGSKPQEALALSQLAMIHLCLGDLDTAELHAHEARQIRESLRLPDAWKDYDTLAAIAEARGDRASATAWTTKRDELQRELERRAKGGGT
jgi:tetratricopeptide (TPR) repeat protein